MDITPCQKDSEFKTILHEKISVYHTMVEFNVRLVDINARGYFFCDFHQFEKFPIFLSLTQYLCIHVYPIIWLPYKNLSFFTLTKKGCQKSILKIFITDNNLDSSDYLPEYICTVIVILGRILDEAEAIHIANIWFPTSPQ
jgi:hypothetical protein